MNDFMKISVLGGGIFGCWIASQLASSQLVKSVTLYEKNSDVMLEASKNNQHRYHLGYHYPRSSETINQILSTGKEFDVSFKDCTFPIDENLYLISKKESLTSADQFSKVFQSHDIKTADLDKYEKHLFVDKFEHGFLVKERGLNNHLIRQKILDFMKNCKNLTVKTNQEISSLDDSDLVVNCTYTDINLTSDISLKYELCVLTLVKNPFEKTTAFTVVDGKFPSLYPTENLDIYTLSHVEKTPIFKTIDLEELKRFRNNITLTDIEKANKDIIDASSEFFRIKFQIAGQYLTYKVKYQNDVNDVRTSNIIYSGNKISLLQGKITTLCSVANEIKQYAEHYSNR